jgi:serine/threonine protein kinase
MKPFHFGDGSSPGESGQTPTELARPRQKDAQALGLLKDRYLLEKELGRGAIGVVYLARDQQLHSRFVVIKVLQKESESKAWLKKKFLQEIEALSRVNHPGIVGILDAGEMSDGKMFLVMQFVNGSDLHSVIPKEGMPLEQIANIVRQIGQALSSAHDQGICHRDLKPANIMLERTAPDSVQAKIIDFGIAAVRNSEVTTNWETSTIAGSLVYMAPEQLKGRPSTASDIYALGVIVYEMVTGRLPFLPKSAVHLYQMQQQGVIIKPIDLRPDLPETAQEVILKALSFDPSVRPSQAREFGEELALALNDSSKYQPEPPEPSTLEIAHVLFMDIVGYSTLTIDRQTYLLQQLQDIVRETPEVKRAQAANRLIRLPTGDGMALAFFQDPIAPVQCALNISQALKTYPHIKLRMGIHSGPVSRIADINANKNIAGGGINIAQRVMDCGDAGHILLSRNVAEILNQLSDWANSLYDLGELIVKHGARVHLFNLYTRELGNPAIPAKLRPRHAFLPALFIILAVLAVGTIGILAWTSWFSPSIIPIQTTNAERLLSYSVTVQKYRDEKPYQEPFQLASEINFERDYRARLNLSSPQSGHLYILNEGPILANDLPSYVLLFPSPTANGGSSLLQTNQQVQIPEKSWFMFDEEQGTEKLWLVWSTHSIAELEAVKSIANPRDDGEIRQHDQIKAVRDFLEKYSVYKPEVKKDEAGKRTNVIAKGEVLVAPLELEHH